MTDRRQQGIDVVNDARQAIRLLRERELEAGGTDSGITDYEVCADLGSMACVLDAIWSALQDADGLESHIRELTDAIRDYHG